MTRDEFDSLHAATDRNTEGFTTAQLAAINDAVFAAVSDIDDIDMFYQVLQSSFDRAFAAHSA